MGNQSICKLVKDIIDDINKHNKRRLCNNIVNLIFGFLLFKGSILVRIFFNTSHSVQTALGITLIIIGFIRIAYSYHKFFSLFDDIKCRACPIPLFMLIFSPIFDLNTLGFLISITSILALTCSLDTTPLHPDTDKPEEPKKRISYSQKLLAISILTISIGIIFFISRHFDFAEKEIQNYWQAKSVIMTLLIFLQIKECMSYAIDPLSEKNYAIKSTNKAAFILLFLLDVIQLIVGVVGFVHARISVNGMLWIASTVIALILFIKIILLYRSNETKKGAYQKIYNIWPCLTLPYFIILVVMLGGFSQSGTQFVDSTGIAIGEGVGVQLIYLVKSWFDSEPSK